MNKLVGEYNNNHHLSISNKAIVANYTDTLNDEIETNPQAPKFTVGDRLKINTYNIFSKGYTGYWSQEMFLNDSELKDNFWVYKIKCLNKEKIGFFFLKKGVTN